MNTRELSDLKGWDEQELQQLVARFVRIHHRLPDADELVAIRRHRSRLHLRLPHRARRGVASLIAGR
jgi:hypothetical protein